MDIERLKSGVEKIRYEEKVALCWVFWWLFGGSLLGL